MQDDLPGGGEILTPLPVRREPSLPPALRGTCPEGATVALTDVMILRRVLAGLLNLPEREPDPGPRPGAGSAGTED